MRTDAARRPRSIAGVLIGLAIVVAIVVGAALWASADPDGLERVAGDHGFLGAAEDNPLVILADYVFPGLDGPIATILAGVIGVAIVFSVAWIIGRLLARRRSADR